MDVLTKTLGTVEVAEEAKLTFAEGLFGFETVTEYALIKSECEPFFWLQALRDQSLAFLVVDPFLVYKDYEPDIDDKSLDSIGITSPNDILILSIVTLPSNGDSPTINLRGSAHHKPKNAPVFSGDNRQPKMEHQTQHR